MKVYYSGFNLYGQVVHNRDVVINAFTEFTYEFLRDISFHHSFSFVSAGEELCIHGAAESGTHEIRKLANHFAHDIRSVHYFNNNIVILNEEGTVLSRNLDEDEANWNVELASLKGRNDYITQMASGSKINVALSKQGRLFNMPNELKFKNDNIAQLTCGREHCLLLDGNGNVYSFGIGSRGQLGRGTLTNETEPKLVGALGGIKITKICAGGWHSAALSERGDIYLWGWNSNGQLGLCVGASEAISVMAAPQLLKFENNMHTKVLDVACGAKHTVLLIGNNKLYGMGWNKYKQLGNIASENVYVPTTLREFDDANVVSLRCGPWSSAVLVNENILKRER